MISEEWEADFFVSYHELSISFSKADQDAEFQSQLSSLTVTVGANGKEFCAAFLKQCLTSAVKLGSYEI